MKAIISIFITIIVTFSTTLLFDWDFVGGHWTRQMLVILLIIMQLLTCFFYLKKVYTKNN